MMHPDIKALKIESLVNQLFYLLDKTETTDTGYVMFPNKITAIHDLDEIEIRKILNELRKAIK